MARIARIRVLETLTEGRYQTYRVLDPAENQTLLAHYGDLSLLEVADKLGSEVLERGDSGGFAYFLTPDRPELRNLNLPLPAKEPPKAEPAAPEPGEFTRMFKIPVVATESAAKSAAAPPPAPVAPPPPPTPPAPVSQEPAQDFSFTGIFTSLSKISAETPSAPKPAASEPIKPTVAPPAAAAPPPVSTPEPTSTSSDFTAMFRSPNVAPPPAAAPEPAPKPSVMPVPAATPVAPPPPAAPSGSASGEFTRMFSVPPPARQEPEKPQRARPVDSGEFTRMFTAVGPAPQPPAPPPAAPPAAPPPPPAQPPVSSFTASFQQPRQPSYPAPPPPFTPAAPPHPSAPEPPRQSSGPGEFTRMFEAKPKAGEIPLPQPPAHHDDGDFTRFFNNPLPSSREPDWKAVERQPAPPPTRKADGDFTRMFGRVETPAAPSRSAPDAPASTGSSGGGGGNSGGVTDLFAKPKPVAQPAPAKGAPDDDFAKKFVPKADAPKVPELPGAVPVQMPPKKAPLLLLAIIVIALLIIGACALYYLVFRK